MVGKGGGPILFVLYQYVLKYKYHLYEVFIYTRSLYFGTKWYPPVLEYQRWVICQTMDDRRLSTLAYSHGTAVPTGIITGTHAGVYGCCSCAVYDGCMAFCYSYESYSR